MTLPLKRVRTTAWALAGLTLVITLGAAGNPQSPSSPAPTASSGITLAAERTPTLSTSASAAVKVWDAKTHFALYPTNNAYPWVRDQTQGLDTYGMVKRQCVSFVAWYINVHGTPFGWKTKGPKGVGTFDNARVWDAAAFQAGFVVSTRPVVGSVAQWHAYEKSTWATPTFLGWTKAGAAGHVAIVTRVYGNGNVDLAEYNGTNPRGYGVAVNVRAPRYIHIPLLSPRVG